MTAVGPVAGERQRTEARMPPVTEVGAASMISIAAGVIYIAAYLPKRAPLGIPVALLLLAAALQLANAVLLARTRGFAWHRFFQVGRWALLAYAVIAGMIEFAFLYDHTRGLVLAVMTLMLALFMLNVPVLIGFTVARYERAGDVPAPRAESPRPSSGLAGRDGGRATGAGQSAPGA